MSAEPLAEHGTDGKDAALSEDIRLLGRLLGDVVRGQAGDEVFALVEGVRQRAVGDRRDGRSPLDALVAALPGRSIGDQLHLIRAFGWLSSLANTAEDVHHERRRQYHREHGSRPRSGASPRRSTGSSPPASTARRSAPWSTTRWSCR